MKSQIGPPPPYTERATETNSSTPAGVHPPSAPSSVHQAPYHTVQMPICTPVSAYPQRTYGTVYVPPVEYHGMPYEITVLNVGACPACHVGVLEDSFTCLGLLCAIVFFPLGILCCLAFKEKRCCNCGAIFN